MVSVPFDLREQTQFNAKNKNKTNEQTNKQRENKHFRDTKRVTCPRQRKVFGDGDSKDTTKYSRDTGESSRDTRVSRRHKCSRDTGVSCSRDTGLFQRHGRVFQRHGG